MEQYWPNAIAMTTTKQPFSVSTYDSFNSEESAWKQVDCWREMYTILSAWVTRNGRVCSMESYTDSIGSISKTAFRIKGGE